MGDQHVAIGLGIVIPVLVGQTVASPTIAYKQVGTKDVTHQAWISGTSGAITATVLVHGSNDDTAGGSTPASAAWQLLATMSLTGTGGGAGVSADQGVWPVAAPYKYYKHTLSAISGTGATVSSSIAQ